VCQRRPLDTRIRTGGVVIAHDGTLTIDHVRGPSTEFKHHDADIYYDSHSYLG
jgi:hypothetical protein